MSLQHDRWYLVDLLGGLSRMNYLPLQYTKLDVQSPYQWKVGQRRDRCLIDNPWDDLVVEAHIMCASLGALGNQST